MNWYPVIDYDLCTSCLKCFDKCSHGVYEIKENKPVVVAPDNCVYGCRGCQSLCPSGAIEYVGDTGLNIISSCGCSN